MKSALASALVIAGCASLPVPDTPSSLAAAESAFASQSVREGMRAAFLAWLSPGATMFREGPVDGPAQVAREPDPPIVLDWRPVFVETSASADLGLSTGPWRLRSKADPARPERFGQFVSIWKRGRDGPWRVWVDLGISHPLPALWDAPLAAGATPAASASAGTLAQAEAAFALEAKAAGAATAYATWASPSIRLYREGSAPFIGRDAALGALAGPMRLEWILDRHEASAAGDLGYAIGTFGLSGGAKAGDYVRVWRREADGWRIALDVTNDVKAK